MLARRFVLPAHPPVRLNFTGIVLPSLKTELPSAFTGWRNPDQESFVPMQVPAWQVSVCVQALPSLQLAPSAFAGFEQTPLAGLHVPATWHWSSALHVTGFAP